MTEIIKDDDMILLIVGGEKVSKEDQEDDQNIQLPYSVAIKQEPFDEFECKSDVDKIIQTATKHGEYVEIKEECDIEFMEEEVPIEFVQVKFEEDDIGYDAEENGYIPKHIEDINYGYKMYLKNRRTRAFGRHQQTSFVNQLRETYPEMKKNPKLLVKHLASIMKDLKPPAPPPNFYETTLEDNKIKFVCCICKGKSDSVGSASRHYQAHHGMRYLKCFACGADFRRTTNLYKHEKRCSAADARLVMQARGRYLGRKGRGRPFLTDTKFQAAPRRAANKRPRFYCAKCPATFVHRQNLEAHENSHEGLRPYRCDFCPAAYTSEVGLKRHLQLHSDSQYICDHCGRDFKLKPALISHLDTHRPIRKFGCDHCERRFAQKTALIHHMNREHLNLPPACGCPICPKRYARMSHVTDHMKRAHGLAMITRKMFYKSLPVMADMAAIKDARVVLNSEMNQLTSPRTPRTPKEIKEKHKKEKTEHRTLANAKPSQNKFKIVQDYANSKEGTKVYNAVLDQDKNANIMDEFLQHTQSKAVPGK